MGRAEERVELDRFGGSKVLNDNKHKQINITSIKKYGEENVRM